MAQNNGILIKMNKQHILDLRYLRMARIWAENSYCERRKVGALVVKEKMIISDGYNGTPSGFENVCEDENNITKPYVLHAEATTATDLHFTSRQPPVSSVPNSLSKRASNEWSMARNIGWKTASTCSRKQISKFYILIRTNSESE